MKTLVELFTKYTPGDADRELLSGGRVVRIQANKEARQLVVDAAFDGLVEKDTLYRIESEIADAYDLQYVKLMPKYPSRLFSESYIPEVLKETEQTGIVARGFFNKYMYALSDDVLTVTIPVINGGISLLYNAETPAVIASIIQSEFGIQLTVRIDNTEDMQIGDEMFTDSQTKRLLEIDRELEAAAQRYTGETVTTGTNRRAGGSGGKAAGSTKQEEQDTATRVSSLFDTAKKQNPDVKADGGILRLGFVTFDIGSPEYVIGSDFDIVPVPLSSIDKPMKTTVLVGLVFGVVKDTNRTGDKFNVTFYLTDKSASIECKAFNLEAEQADDLMSVIKDGAAVAIRADVRREIKKDRTEGPDLLVNIRDIGHVSIAKIKEIKRSDNAPVKRVELHLHTQMSAMDALIAPADAVKTAHAWGHPAVAITDHGNVQGFQDAMLTSEKIGQKVIYGIEAYFVNDTAGAVTGKCDGIIGDEAVVFDIETTGLSAKTCRITEIGAVRMRDGEIVDTFDTFVNPECPIPSDITELTHITDEMVADAPLEADALKAFFDFVGRRRDGGEMLLVAHNADFDTGFIREACERTGRPFTNPYLDTLALARYLIPDIKNHKLDTVANHFGLGEFNHHRACDDAEMLARIFAAMLTELGEIGVSTFEQLAQDMSNKADPLKLRSYHQIILVRNKVGQKNLYKLISESYLKYFRKNPRIPKTRLVKMREGLLIGSACESGELFRAVLDNKPETEIESIVSFYDYLEIQPICNNRFLIAEGLARDDEDLRNLNRRIVELGEKYHRPVVATCDAHFMNPEDEIFRKIIMAGMKFKDFDRDVGLYYRTTEEMLQEFAYLGEEKAYEVVVTNTNMIADMIEPGVRPFPKGTFTPYIDGAEQDLTRICYENAHKKYGDPLPEIVEKRLDKELTSIIEHGFAVLYMIAQKLVSYSESQGYLVGSRGSVGSSVVASMAGISEVNPLPPHYWCPKCKYSDFDVPKKILSGFDLPDKLCPNCHIPLSYDGHDIPFETFLGFYGDKSPDIDLNFSGEVQGKVHKFTEKLFGEENVFRAGTIGSLADKTAYGFVMKYLDDKKISVNRAEVNRLTLNCVGVKRTTGQHPGGIVVIPKQYEIYDFCPVQHPADDPNSDIVTTHFTFEYLHDTLLKLDELGHDMPTKYKYLEKFSNTSVLDVPMNDRSIYDLFLSTRPLHIEPGDIAEIPLGTLGLPELGTRFVIKMLQESRPQSFSDLLQISGLSHGTDVWTNNAQDLIKNGTCTISEVIGTRDDIMLTLIRYGVEKSHAFKIMEMVRKGKGLTPEFEAEMRASDVPDWYIASCKKIKYMFPKAHAAAYDMSAIRLGWYKVHNPLAFYCAMFTVQPQGFDGELVMRGKKAVQDYILEIEKQGNDAQAKERQSLPVMHLINEAYARGITFLPVDLEKSSDFQYLPESGKIRMPFSALAGVGDNAAASIVRARDTEPFFSVDDLTIRAGLTKTVIQVLRDNGVLNHLSETDQISMF